MNIESHLVIGKNPYREEEVASGFDPKQLGINAVERLFWTLLAATQERKQVTAFVNDNLTIYINNDWFQEIERLSRPDQEERIMIGVLNTMRSDRAIVVKKTPPIT